jgi:hypothetical protein
VRNRVVFRYRNREEAGVCGKESAAAMDVRELDAAPGVMRWLDFAAKPRRVKPEERGDASLAQLEYIKGMKSEGTLMAFVRRMLTRRVSIRAPTVEKAREVILALRGIRRGMTPTLRRRLMPKIKEEIRLADDLILLCSHSVSEEEAQKGGRALCREFGGGGLMVYVPAQATGA